MPGQRLPHQAKRTAIQLPHRQAQKPGFAQASGKLAAAFIKLFFGNLARPVLLAAPSFQALRQFPAPLVKKRPVKMIRGHCAPPRPSVWRYPAACRASASRISLACSARTASSASACPGGFTGCP